MIKIQPYYRKINYYETEDAGRTSFKLYPVFRRMSDGFYGKGWIRLQFDGEKRNNDSGSFCILQL